MVTKLRKQFVIVTTTLMTVVLGLFLLVSQLYNGYWNTLETVDFLEQLADSGLFLQDAPSDVEKKILNMSERDNPIIGIILSENGDILKKQVLGRENVTDITEDVISCILEKRTDNYKVGKYIYSYRELEDNTRLVVMTDSSVDAKWVYKVLGTVLLIPCGIFILAVITFFLSRFVTEPAGQALLREKRFISDASHELKTPLGAISINAQVLDGQFPENLYVKNILAESKRMGRLIERLLTLSKLEEEEPLPVERISLSEIAEEMSLTFESIAYEKKLDYRYMIDENIDIMGNADELQQLLAILIDNAFKNTAEKGRVEIACKSSRGNAVLSVKNTGQGIAPEDLPHVFERFYTTDTARKNDSFGLGLAIAKAIVERYGGSISADSIPEKETGFTVVFPTV